MKGLAVLAIAILASQVSMPSAGEPVTPPEEFVGDWICVYVSSYNPQKYAPRTKQWSITDSGRAYASGRYSRDHSTGIVGEYRSTMKLEFSDSAFTQELVEYRMIEPVRHGRPMTEAETIEFEQQVMSGQPVVVQFDWINADSFRAISKYTDTLCERAKEASS